MSRFYGDVSRVDRCIGQILDRLDEERVRDDTLLIFTTDHGTATPLAKGTLYDPGLKIGAIFRWPGHIDAGVRCPQLMSNVDLLPTIMEAIGADSRTASALEGVSFWRALTGGDEPDREAIFFEMSLHDFYEPMRGLRTSRHKFIRNFEVRDGLQVAADIRLSPIIPRIRWQLRERNRPEIELYDLDSDPLGRHDLAGEPSMANIESQPHARLPQYLQATNDPILAGPIDISDAYHEFIVRAPAGLP